MQDKTTLINSMNNLIKYLVPDGSHISISRKNQQQMFSSLTRKDFDKIISNLDDTLLKLRITTVKLLAELLYNNATLKLKFCQLMDIHYSHSSNIVLNANLHRILEKYHHKETQIFTLLKRHQRGLREQQQDRRAVKQPLLWFINPKNNKLCIEYIQREQFALISNFTSNKNIQFDPIDCIFGIVSSPDADSNSDMKTSTHFSVLSDSHPKSDLGKDTDGSQKSITHRQVNYQPVHVPMSTKNSVFLKQNNSKVGNYSFSHNTSQGLNQMKKAYREHHRNGITQEVITSSPDHLEYLNMSMNLQPQPHSSTSKKQNEEKHTSLSQKDKYANRLSLQINDMKSGHRKVNTFENESSELKVETTLPNEHHHGIKLMTPRQSLKNPQKLIVVNSGANTDRTYSQRQATLSDKQKFTDPHAQRIKTIHLGGNRGSETNREKKNIKIQRH